MVGERFTLRTVELEVDCAVHEPLCLYEEGKAYAQAVSFLLDCIFFNTTVTYILDQGALASGNCVRYRLFSVIMPVIQNSSLIIPHRVFLLCLVFEVAR